jgi:hypothetical protein
LLNERRKGKRKKGEEEGKRRGRNDVRRQKVIHITEV